MKSTECLRKRMVNHTCAVMSPWITNPMANRWSSNALASHSRAAMSWPQSSFFHTYLLNQWCSVPTLGAMSPPSLIFYMMTLQCLVVCLALLLSAFTCMVFMIIFMNVGKSSSNKYGVFVMDTCFQFSSLFLFTLLAFYLQSHEKATF